VFAQRLAAKRVKLRRQLRKNALIKVFNLFLMLLSRLPLMIMMRLFG